MIHYGIVCPPVSGHLHPMGALAYELRRRGHRVTCFQVLDLEEKIRKEGMDFEPVGQADHPRGSLPESLRQLGQLGGLAALRFTIAAVARTSAMLLRDLPSAVARTDVDALIVDQMEPAGGAVAEHLGIPFVTVCNALALNREAAVPPAFAPWRYADTAAARLRNRIGYTVSDWLMRPVANAVAEARRAWALPPLRHADDSYSRRAQISQLPAALDFPRRELPAGFHYVGPLRRPRDDLRIPFPWDRLDGRPVVYASLGTLQNTREALFRVFVEACRDLGVQLVLSHGGGLTEAQAAGLAQDALVVPYAPQCALMKHARLTITHAGLNTVLDSLGHGVPVVAIPITYEQPAIAQRVAHHGAGFVLPLNRTTTRTLREAVERVLHTGAYTDAARTIAASCQAAGGVERAAELIEQHTRPTGTVGERQPMAAPFRRGPAEPTATPSAASPVHAREVVTPR